MKILLTGFRPYGGERVNASEQLIRALRRRRPKLRPTISLHYEILPTDRSNLLATLPGMLKKHEPDLAVMFGQAPGRNRICIEQQARNDFLGQPIREDGPVSRQSTLPRTRMMIRGLQRASIPAATSDDAGDYFCNMALYLALEFASEADWPMKSGFVHVPVLPRQVIQSWPDAPSLSLDMQVEAASVVLAVLARGKR